MKSLEKLTKRRVNKRAILTQDFATQLTFISEELRRVVAVLIDRSGHVTDVMVGDSDRVFLPDIGRQRGGDARFRGIRLVRTNLRAQKNKPVELSSDDLADLSQLQLDVVASVAVGPGGYPGQVAWAHLIPLSPAGEMWETHHSINPSELEAEVEFDHFIAEVESEYQRKSKRARTTNGTPAMLAYVNTPGSRDEEVHLAEMVELCRTAGVSLVDTIVQKRSSLHPKYAMGKGKIEELTQRSVQLGADLLIFAQDLQPGQLRAITSETDLKVIDRTQLILDIFAQHAKSRDGKLQVELAQLRYNLPRLSDRNTGMSRLAGGIGGRGPGETKLEINRRRARDRMTKLEQEIKKLEAQRTLRRQKRQNDAIPIVSIVGYTNAGKSTLLNHLTLSDVLSEDKLFATLRPTSRRLDLARNRDVVLTDTVGFIHELPPDLVSAFKATLEELGDADLLLHLVDISEEEYEERIEAVNRILADLELGDKERILVFNKIDLVSSEIAQALARRHDAIMVSAVQPETFKELKSELERRLFARKKA